MYIHIYVNIIYNIFYLHIIYRHIIYIRTFDASTKKGFPGRSLEVGMVAFLFNLRPLAIL